MLRLFFVCALLWVASGCSTTAGYTVANAHSHNDYNRPKPFHNAYALHYGSIEADIFLDSSGTELLVGHSREETLGNRRTLDSLYLSPLSYLIQQNGGRVFKDPKSSLILLIDLKTQAGPTLEVLVNKLRNFPAVINCSTLRIVISGNRPPPDQFHSYPAYIWFDGRPTESYSDNALQKIAMISTAFPRGGQNKPLSDANEKSSRAMIEKAHGLGKPFRFWGTPDDAGTWKKLMEWKVDFINTDKIEELAVFLN